METNAIMRVRFGDRKLTIGHKDKMGSLNELISIGNDYRVENGKEPMRMDKILELKGISEYIIMLENKENLNSPKSGDLEVSDIKGVRHVLKTKRGKYGGTWSHLNIMVRIAIEMNPEFADDVITTFVKGKLLEYRDIAGDDFKILSAAIRIFDPTTSNRISMARGLNYIVFNTHYRDIRNTGTTEQLKEMVDIQQKLAFAIDMNYIKTFDELVIEMRKMWHKKWD
jgi:hypothetical protein